MAAIIGRALKHGAKGVKKVLEEKESNKCKRCGAEISTNQNHCKYCGNSLQN